MAVDNIHLYLLYENRDDWIEKCAHDPFANTFARFLDEPTDLKEIIGHLKEIFTVTTEPISPLILQKISSHRQQNHIPVLWNLTDGYGRYLGSYLPAYAHLLELKFIGSDAYSQMLCQNKHQCKAILNAQEIPTAPWAVVRGKPDLRLIQERLKGTTFFVKPADLDNGAGDTIVNPRVNSLSEAMDAASVLHDAGIEKVLIEEFLPGKEYTVTCVQDGEWYFDCFNVNYSGDFFHSSVKDLSKPRYSRCNGIIRDKLMALTHESIKILNITDYCRFDFREDQNGKICFLEVNTRPFLITDTFRQFAVSFYGGYSAMFRALVSASVSRQS